MAKNHPDFILLLTIAVLVIWGAFTMATVSFPFSLEKFGGSWQYAKHQMIFGLLPGLILGFFAFITKIETIKKLSFLFFVLNLLLVILVFVPGLGAEINGARRWLKLGNIMFQPSEFLKISFVLYISAWLSNRFKTAKTAEKKQAAIVFVAATLALTAILSAQRDLSTLIIIFLIGFLVYFLSSTPWWHYFFLILAATGGVGLLVKLEPYRLNRVLTIFNQHMDPLGNGYQLTQSLISVGSGKIFGIGGFFGSGLGLSRQKFGFIPQPMTDSIFAVIGEELGFMGGICLISLFFTILWRGINISLKTSDEFSRFLTLGLSFWLVIQAFFNIAGIIGILPLAGIPLPFFSYGSSHLIVESIAAGLLLNVSKKV